MRVGFSAENASAEKTKALKNTERMVDTKPETLFMRQLALGPMKNFVYLIGSPDSRECVVIDPAWDVGALLKFAENEGRRIVGALVTHGHGDHTNGLAPLLEAVDVPVYAHEAEVARFDGLRALGHAVRPVSAGQTLDIAGVSVQCIHTPGHTPGSQCFHVRESLVSGDTVFVNACGRCDLGGGDAAQMFDSLHRVLGALPAATRLLPGHDYGDVPQSTLARERERNPYFQLHELPAFVQYRNRPR